jgi:hypothetical protein
MSSPYAYPEAKSVLIAMLTRDALLHEAGRYGDLGADFDEVDGRLPRNGSPEFEQLFLAFEFWSGWLDSAEHDWFFYEPIHEADWPVLARDIVSDLEAERETKNPVLLKHFVPKLRGASLLTRVRALFHGGDK